MSTHGRITAFQNIHVTFDSPDISFFVVCCTIVIVAARMCPRMGCDRCACVQASNAVNPGTVEGSLEACKSKCMHDGTCKAANYDVNSGACWTKTANAPLEYPCADGKTYIYAQKIDDKEC